MMLARPSPLWALLCLCLYFNIVVAGVVRRDDAPASTTSSLAPTTTETEVPASSTFSDSSTLVAITTTSSTSSAASATASGLLNSTLFNNVTIPEGELPYTPVVTPAWGVAGVILLATGLVYALIGIKTQWIYTFFSTAYLTALATTVLIVYVAPLPVSDGVQGGLLVAAVCTGLLFGGIAVVFKDITECMGCLLGGFCFSMWLLTLQPGGLLTQTGPKVALIAAFTLGSFALYFSHWTRTYGLIVSVAFAGATVTVLGIDCFSRAGLKEFWCYIWALNENIFPLGTVTYPLTRGIRVELAVTIILAVLGIVSQLRVWRIIQAHRAKRDAIQAEEEQKKEDEDANIGRQVVETNDRELRAWERVYGNAPINPVSADSGVGGMESEKRKSSSADSTSTPTPNSAETENQSGTGVEPAELAAESDERSPPPPPPKPTAAEMVISHNAQDGVLTVRVAQDDIPNGHVYDSVPGGIENEAAWRREGQYDEKTAVAISEGTKGPNVVVPPPSVTPLPFHVPKSPSSDIEDDERSSVATFADENDEHPVTTLDERRQSLARRLSTGSAELLRRMSQRSKGSKANAPEIAEDPTPSREELLESRQSIRDDNDSVAANLDDLSSNGDMDTVRDEDESHDIEVTADLGDRDGEPTVPQAGSIPAANNEAAAAPSEPDTAKGSGGKSSRGPKSTVSVASTQASLTKANLPRPMSRVAMSYRTNEWAKHLGVAETPAPENLTLHQYPEEAHETAKAKEPAAPVNIMELQQTAVTAALPPAAPRSATAMANYVAQQTLGRRVSSTPALVQHQSGSTPNPEPQGRTSSPSGPPLAHQNKAFRSKSGSLLRRASTIQVQAIVEEATSGANDSVVGVEDSSSSRSNSVPPSPTLPDYVPSASRASLRAPVAGVVSYSSPQTLLGQRDLYLRNKSRTSFVPPTPDPHAAHMASLAAMQAPRSSSENGGSVYNQPATTPVRQSPVDMDDLPMSQRREIIRQISHGTGPRPGSITPGHAAIGVPATTADRAAFDSHQPQRDSSHLKSVEAREAQLREFRNSVAAELRAGTPQPQVFATMDRTGLSGRTSLMGPPTGPGDALVLQAVEQSRSALKGQKDAESHAREMARLERERSEVLFEQRMRADVSFQEAHRDALRRLQGQAKDH